LAFKELSINACLWFGLNSGGAFPGEAEEAHGENGWK